MKLKAKPEYWRLIRSGKKLLDYRSAHITFVNTHDGRKYVRDVTGVYLIPFEELPVSLRGNTVLFDEGESVIVFELSPEKRVKKKGKAGEK